MSFKNFVEKERLIGRGHTPAVVKAAPSNGNNRKVKTMFGYTKVKIAENERALLFKDNNFDRVLEPGEYRLWRVGKRHQVEVFDLTEPKFSHKLVDLLVANHKEVMDQYFEQVDLGDQQVAYVCYDGKLVNVLAPGSKRFYWKGPVKVAIEVQDISETFALEKDKARMVAYSPNVANKVGLGSWIAFAEVKDKHVGLLRVDGHLQEVLPPGFCGFWRFNRAINVEVVDTRLQAMEVTGQEILTKDKVTLRINLNANYRIDDPVVARRELSNVEDYLYKELQFGLREVVGTRGLDELLANKDELNDVIYKHAVTKANKFGIEVISVGVKDIILPGDMKLILNQVMEAEKAAQANVIKRREETAATRSLLNTAKVMENNPTLLRLKELEVLEKVTEKVDNITVYGGMDSILRELVQIKA